MGMRYILFRPEVKVKSFFGLLCRYRSHKVCNRKAPCDDSTLPHFRVTHPGTCIPQLKVFPLRMDPGVVQQRHSEYLHRWLF